MAWKSYIPEAISKPRMSAVALTIPPAGASAKPILLLDDSTVKALGWAAGTALGIAIGTNEHAGQIKVFPEAGAPTTLFRSIHKHYKRSRVKLGRMPCLATDAWRGPVSFAIEPSTTIASMAALVIIVPELARAHELPAGTAAAVKRAVGR